MRVPLIIAGTDINPEVINEEVSIRRVFDTILNWAGSGRPIDLLTRESEIVLAEAMRPYLQYGWQPQVMAIWNGLKVIRSKQIEIYDLRVDPNEIQDLAPQRRIPQVLRDSLQGYPFRPTLGVRSPDQQLSDEDKKRLASLGYVDWEGQSGLRKDAPSAREMTSTFADLDYGSRLFTQGSYREVIPIFKRVLTEDPNNLMVALRLGVAYSLLNEESLALRYFQRARELNPGSIDVMHYLAMHYLHTGNRLDAAPLLRQVLSNTPQRLSALEGMAQVHEQEGNLEEAAKLLERVVVLRPEPTAALLRLGAISMALGKTPAAIHAFEQARETQGPKFDHLLELGVCYLANRQFAAARDCLDQIPSAHPEYAMALFKRAQVSVLLREPDSAARIRQAYKAADRSLRKLIASEALFQGISIQ